MNARERWDALQERWAQGESLSPAEEQERLAYAAHDVFARRELEAFAALRAHAAAEGEPLSPVLIQGALEAVADGPRLRVVGDRDPGAPVATRPRRIGGWIFAAASLALAGALGVFALVPSATPHRLATSAKSAAHAIASRSSRAELVFAAGEVLVDGKAGSVDRHALRPGGTLTTGAGRACFTIAPAIDVCLAERTTVVLESLAATSVRVRVDSGLALASLARRKPGSSFSLLAGDLAATARGTIFSVRNERNEAEVTVVEGSVQVVRGGVTAQIGAHSRVRAAFGSALERAPVSPEDEAHLLRLRSVQAVALDDTAGEARRFEAPLERTAEVATNDAAEKPSAASLLNAARSELARGNPRAALALYEKLRASHPASSEAHTVLPTVGRLRLDLGNASAALRAFDAYLGRPGTLAPEALSGKIRALRALGQRDAERAAVQQYLARYPKGLERPLLERRLAELGGP